MQGPGPIRNKFKKFKPIERLAMNRIVLSLILICLPTSTGFSGRKSDFDPIPFKFFASFKRIEKGNPIIAGKVPEWAAAAHAIVVDKTVHYIWALRGRKDRRWTMMHSFAPVSDPSAVTHDPRNPILSPSADGFDSMATEYPFPFWNPHDRTYYAYYLGRPRGFPKQTGLLVRGDDFGKWRRVFKAPVIAAEAEYERDGSSHPSVAVVGDTIHIIYTGESKKPPVICHATAPVSNPAKVAKDPANPVFTGTGQSWDGRGVREAEIFKGPHYFHILYGGSDGKVWRIGHVRTRDFHTFEPNPYNPVFVPPSDREAWDCDGILTPQVFEAGGLHFLLYAGKKGGEWQTGLARAERPRKDAVRTVAGHPAEGGLESFLGEPRLDIQQVHKGGRFPNIIVAVDGSVPALWGGVKLRRSEDGGETWGAEIMVANGFMGGGAIANESNGEIPAFVEKHHPPAALTVYSSQDQGKTWSETEVVIKPDSRGNVPSMHMNEHGITLRHGKYAGRIVRAARNYAGRNERSRWPQHYTTAIYDYGCALGRLGITRSGEESERLLSQSCEKLQNALEPEPNDFDALFGTLPSDDHILADDDLKSVRSRQWFEKIRWNSRSVED